MTIPNRDGWDPVARIGRLEEEVHALKGGISSVETSLQEDISELRTDVKGLRTSLYTFALTVAGSALALCGTILVAVQT